MLSSTKSELRLHVISRHCNRLTTKIVFPSLHSSLRRRTIAVHNTPLQLHPQLQQRDYALPNTRLSFPTLPWAHTTLIRPSHRHSRRNGWSSCRRAGARLLPGHGCFRACVLISKHSNHRKALVYTMPPNKWSKIRVSWTECGCCCCCCCRFLMIGTHDDGEDATGFNGGFGGVVNQLSD